MSRRLTTRTLLLLLTAAMISVQSAGVSYASQCRSGVSCCGSSSSSLKSCCGSGQRKGCSDSTSCCCKSSQSRCSEMCGCGRHESVPAVPNRSQTRDDLRQLLTLAVSQPVVLLFVKRAPRSQVIESSIQPTAKADVHVTLCVWLT
jgi:hypothetical protein